MPSTLPLVSQQGTPPQACSPQAQSAGAMPAQQSERVGVEWIREQSNERVSTVRHVVLETKCWRHADAQQHRSARIVQQGMTQHDTPTLSTNRPKQSEAPRRQNEALCLLSARCALLKCLSAAALSTRPTQHPCACCHCCCRRFHQFCCTPRLSHQRAPRAWPVTCVRFCLMAQPDAQHP